MSAPLKNNILLLGLLAIVLVLSYKIGRVFSEYDIVLVPKIPPTEETIACTSDVKICSDGSAVGRISPGCDFATCPTGSTLVPECIPLPPCALPGADPRCVLTKPLHGSYCQLPEDTTQPTNPQQPAPPLTGTWIVQSVDGVPATGQITLTADGNMQAHLCNTMGGTYTATDKQIEITNVNSTMMFCSDTDKTNTERIFAALAEKPIGYILSADTLNLMGRIVLQRETVR